MADTKLKSLKIPTVIAVLYIGSYLVACFGLLYGYILNIYMAMLLGAVFAIVAEISWMVCSNLRWKYRHNYVSWISLNNKFILIEIFLAMIILFVLQVPPSWNNLDKERFVQFQDLSFRGLYLGLSLTFSIAFIWYFQGVQNLFGMDYESSDKVSVLGAKSYAQLALNFLRQKDESGVDYLAISIKMIRDFLRKRRKVVEHLEIALQTTTNLDLFNIKDLSIFEELANSLTSLPILDDLLNYLDEFSKKPSIVLVSKLKSTGEEIGFLSKIKAGTIISLLAIIVTLIPEIMKTLIVSKILESIGFIMIIFFVFPLIFIYVIISKKTLKLVVETKELRKYEGR
jgi:hypothetical protein